MMFFQGTLQEGIALAVNEAKAVICFVRDESHESEVWEKEYFLDDESARVLEAKSVTMRLTAGSQEAGYLTSFCPIIKFPAVVVIKNGMLREYFVPEISKDDFHNRLAAALEDKKPSDQSSSAAQPSSAPQPDSPVETSTTPAPAPAATAPSAPSAPRPQPLAKRKAPEKPKDDSVRAEKQWVENAEASSRSQAAPTSSSPQKPQQHKVGPRQSINIKQAKKDTGNASSQRQSPVPSASEPSRPVGGSTTGSDVRQASTPTLPKQYRLQVRLFDGSSVRSSFSPSQTISGDVRPWLDAQMVDETRPYNLKHILTPLPNRTLTIAEEAQTLENSSLGSTANLVMIPIQSFTEAYATSGSSLPVRAAYATYELVSSAVGTATGLVGSFLGYGQTTPTPPSETASAASSSSGDAARRPRPPTSRGPNIRTLRDQREAQKDNEFYNGNQLNFEPQNRPDDR